MKRGSGHTEWCAGGHRCTLGEHRSAPMAWETNYGGLVATLVGRPSGQWLELRVTVRLEDAAESAGWTGRLLAARVNAVVGDVWWRRVGRRLSLRR